MPPGGSGRLRLRLSAASGSPLAAQRCQLHTQTVFHVPGTLCWRHRGYALPLWVRVAATPESHTCASLPLTHCVVHPKAAAGAVSMNVMEARAAAARMSFFIIVLRCETGIVDQVR